MYLNWSMKSAGTSLNTCISSHWEISRIMIRVGRGVFIEDTNHRLYNACQQVGSWILPIVLISKSKYILLFLKYVKIRDLDCKKNIPILSISFKCLWLNSSMFAVAVLKKQTFVEVHISKDVIMHLSL